MSLLAWIVLGLIAGYVASRIVNGRGQGGVAYIALGIVGAVIAGWLHSAFGMEGVAEFSVYGLLVAAAGAIMLLWLYRAVSGGAR